MMHVFPDVFSCNIKPSILPLITEILLYSPQSICSTLGQGLKTSTYPGEVIFSIALAIFGLILFALLIGNMQVNFVLHLMFYLTNYIVEIVEAPRID